MERNAVERKTADHFRSLLMVLFGVFAAMMIFLVPIEVRADFKDAYVAREANNLVFCFNFNGGGDYTVVLSYPGGGKKTFYISGVSGNGSGGNISTKSTTGSTTAASLDNTNRERGGVVYYHAVVVPISDKNPDVLNGIRGKYDGTAVDFYSGNATTNHLGGFAWRPAGWTAHFNDGYSGKVYECHFTHNPYFTYNQEVLDQGQKITSGGTTVIPGRTGYTLNGWTRGDDNHTYYPAGSRDWFSNLDTYNAGLFTANWTPNQYDIIFNPNGGTLDGSTAEKRNPSNVKLIYDGTNYNQYNLSSRMNRTGYTFAGWYTAPNGGTLIYDTNGVAHGDGYWKNKRYVHAGDLHLYAHWTVNQYRLNVDLLLPDGSEPYQTGAAGTFECVVGDSTAWDNVKHTDMWVMVNYNDGVWIRNIAPAAGLHFDSIEGTNKSDRGNGTYRFQMPASALTITIKTAWNSYYVHFDSNGGDGGTMNNQTFTYQTAQNLTKNGFSKNGYAFDHWNTKADDSGTSYTNEQSVNNLTPTNGGTVTLYAIWKWNVQFDANKDTCNTWDNTVSGNTNPVNNILWYSRDNLAPGVTLPENGYQIYGMTFLGWSTDRYANAAAYEDKANIKNNPNTASSICTLYAIWRPTTYNINYVDIEDSDNFPGKQTTYTPAYGGISFTNPSRIGHKFMGWTSTELGVTNAFDVSKTREQLKTLVDGGMTTITMTANWEEVEGDFVDEKTDALPLLRETKNNQGKFRVEEIQQAEGYIYEDQYHDVDIMNDDKTFYSADDAVIKPEGRTWNEIYGDWSEKYGE